MYRVIECIGKGQFGKVDKGVWTCFGNQTDVAIKTLKGTATEEEETKFLQEAAIHGQFHHPNIVKLHGVLTVSQPVSNLELCILLSVQQKLTCNIISVLHCPHNNSTKFITNHDRL